MGFVCTREQIGLLSLSLSCSLSKKWKSTCHEAWFYIWQSFVAMGNHTPESSVVDISSHETSHLTTSLTLSHISIGELYIYVEPYIENSLVNFFYLRIGLSLLVAISFNEFPTQWWWWWFNPNTSSSLFSLQRNSGPSECVSMPYVKIALIHIIRMEIVSMYIYSVDAISCNHTKLFN